MTSCIVGRFASWDIMPRGTLYHWSFRHLGRTALGSLSLLCFALGRFVAAAILLVGYVYIVCTDTPLETIGPSVASCFT